MLDTGKAASHRSIVRLVVSLSPTTSRMGRRQSASRLSFSLCDNCTISETRVFLSLSSVEIAQGINDNRKPALHIYASSPSAKQLHHRPRPMGPTKPSQLCLTLDLFLDEVMQPSAVGAHNAHVFCVGCRTGCRFFRSRRRSPGSMFTLQYVTTLTLSA